MSGYMIVVITMKTSDNSGEHTPVYQRFQETYSSKYDANNFVWSIRPRQGNSYTGATNFLRLQEQVRNDMYWSNSYGTRFAIVPVCPLQVRDTGDAHTVELNPLQDVREYEYSVTPYYSYAYLQHKKTGVLFHAEVPRYYDMTGLDIVKQVAHDYRHPEFDVAGITLKAITGIPEMTIHAPGFQHVTLENPTRTVSALTLMNSGVSDALESWSYQGCNVSRLLRYSLEFNSGYSIPRCTSANVSDVQFDGELLKYRDMRRTDGKEIYVTTKPRKVIEKMLHTAFHNELTDADYEKFVNRIKAHHQASQGEFSIVRGYEIADWYQEERYAASSLTGTLGDSCMRDVPSDCFDIYASNPLQVSMLIRVNGNGDLLGRAIVWNASDGITLMDRVYGTEVTQQHFFEYARLQGWYRKTHQNYSTPKEITTPDGDEIIQEISVTLEHRSHAMYPYLDSLKYASHRGRDIFNTNEYEILFNSTSGGYSSWSGGDYRSIEPNSDECRDCGRGIPEDTEYCDDCRDSHNSCESCGTDCGEDRFCETCYEFVCSSCDEYDSYGFHADVNLCRECFSETYTHCDECGETVSQDETHTVNDSDYCETCYRDLICSSCGVAVLTEDEITRSSDSGLSVTVCGGCLESAIADDYRQKQFQAGQISMPGFDSAYWYRSNQFGYMRTLELPVPDNGMYPRYMSVSGILGGTTYR